MLEEIHYFLPNDNVPKQLEKVKMKICLEYENCEPVEFAVKPNSTFKDLIEWGRKEIRQVLDLEMFALVGKPITENQLIQDYYSGIELPAPICRLCSKPDNDFIYIFDEFGMENKIAEMIELTLRHEVTMTDSFPKQICKGCFKILKELFDSANQELHAQTVFSIEEPNSNVNLTMVAIDDSGREVMSWSNVPGTSGQEANSSNNERNATPLNQEDNDVGQQLNYLKLDASCSNANSSSKNYICSNDLDTTNSSYSVDPSEIYIINESQKDMLSITTDFDSLNLKSLTCNMNSNQVSELYPNTITAVHTSETWIDNSTNISELQQESNSGCSSSNMLSINEFQENRNVQVFTIHCGGCGQMLKDLKRYLESFNSKDSVFKCLCQNSFDENRNLINQVEPSHQNCALQVAIYSCTICFEAFPKILAVISHKENQHTFLTNDEEKYGFHINMADKVFICEYCERCYLLSNVLNSHREYHLPESPYECKMCGLTFLTYEQVEAHRRTHSQTPSEYSRAFAIPKAYSCKYCEMFFFDKKEYGEHCNVCNGMEPYQEQHCLSQFGTISEAMTQSSGHSINPQPSSSTKYYECHYCNKLSHSKDVFIKHLRVHTGEKPFICRQCGKGFSQSSGLRSHEKVHSSERPYPCSFCSKAFKRKCDRDTHSAIHTADRPYTCDVCNKSFTTPQVYRQHRNTHTEKRPYKCDICEKAFKRANVLFGHKLIHSGVKPYTCQTCGKLFRQRSVLIRHKTNIHKDQK